MHATVFLGENPCMMRLTHLCAALLLIALTPELVRPQPMPEALPPAKLPGESAVLARRLGEVQKRAEQEQWPEVVDEYHRLLEEAGDDLAPLDPQQPSHCVPVRRLCHVRLAAMPPAARRLYRARVDDQAKQWLDEGVERRDPLPLRRLVEQAFCSRHAERALDLLGDLAFERGDFEQAERWWGMLARPASLLKEKPPELALLFPDPQSNLAPVRAKVILAQLYRGQREAAVAELAAFRTLHGNAEGQLAGRSGKLADILQDAVTHADQLAVTADDRSWPTLGGDGMRNRRFPAVPRCRFLEEPWRVPLETRPPNPVGKVRTPSRAAQACAFCPVIADDKVLIADARSVTAYDLFTGRLLGDCDVARELKNAGLFPEANPPTPSEVRYTLTVAGGRVFARLGSRMLGDPRGDAGKDAFEVGEGRADSFLVCLGLQPDERGKLPIHWWLKARGVPKEPSAFYEGAPLVRDGRVHIARTRFDGPTAHTFIDCYDAATGAVRWQQEVCEAREAGDGRRFQHHLLTTAGANVVYCSHSGAVVALDWQSGQRAWAMRYPRRGERQVDGQASPRDLAPCVCADGRLFVAPRDAERIFCLDADSGRPLWESKPVEVMHLLGVARGRLIFTTGARPHGIRALDAASGRDLRGWLQPGDGSDMPTIGRGLLAGDLVLWPTQYGLRVLNQEDGQVAADLFVPDVNPIKGNLAVGHGCLVVATAQELLGFVPESVRLEQRRKEAAEKSGAALPQFRLAVALADAGQTEKALEALALAEKLASPGEQTGTLPLTREVPRLRQQLLLERAAQAEARQRWDEAAEVLTTVSNNALPAVRLQALMRKAELWEKAAKPERAVEAWQAILADEHLRSALFDGGTLKQQAGLTAERRIGKLMAVRGKDVYAPLEAQAQKLWANVTEENRIRVVERLMDEFPNAEATATAIHNATNSRPQMQLRILRWYAQRSEINERGTDPWASLAVEYEIRRAWDAARAAWRRCRSVAYRSRAVAERTAHLHKFLEERSKQSSSPLLAPPSLPDLKMPLTRAWQVPLRGETMLVQDGASAAGAEHFFLLSEARALTCRAALTSRLIWTRPLDHDSCWTGRHGDLVIAAGSLGISCVHAADGSPWWHFDVSGEPLSTFRLAAGCLLFLQGERRLWALDVETGEVLWDHRAPAAQLHLPEPGGRFSPLYHVGADWVIVQTTRGHCWVLDTLTGQRLHEFDTGREAWRRPPLPLDERRLVIVPDAQHIASLDLVTGKEIWRYSLGRETSLTGEPPQVLAGGDALLMLVPRNVGNRLSRLDPATRTVRWPKPILLGDEALDLSRSVITADTAYVVVGDLLRAFALADGKPLWDCPLIGGAGPWRVQLTRHYLLAHPAAAATELDIAHALRRYQAANPAAAFPTSGLIPLAAALPTVLAVHQQTASTSQFPLLVIDRTDGRRIQRLNFASHGPQAMVTTGARGVIVALPDSVWGLH
jgi:outer membrane protein assembly factor BamB